MPPSSAASRLPVIGVMGSGSDSWPELARPLGELVARCGWHLLTGGGAGVMAEVGRAFTGVAERRGLSIGVLRSRKTPVRGPDGARHWEAAAENEHLELVLRTPLPRSDRSFASRNHINVLSADALVVLPGGSGTLSELYLRVEYGGRAVLLLGAGSVGGRSAEELLADPHLGPRLTRARSPGEVEAAIHRELETG